MGTNSTLSHNGAVIRYDAGLLAQMEPGLFDVGWLERQRHLRGISAGRNQAYFIHYAEQDMVLRHFRRGGLVGRLNRSLYAGRCIRATRAMREFDLLQWMYAQELPVPRPVAACVWRWGPLYRAALLTLRIAEARPLQELLAEDVVPHEVWVRVGAVIGRMHAAGVYHSDLNCRNILIDGGGQVWLIDFDKCDRRAAGAWRAQNLARLQRSLRKEQAKGAARWDAQDWDALMRGYEGGI